MFHFFPRCQPSTPQLAFVSLFKTGVVLGKSLKPFRISLRQMMKATHPPFHKSVKGTRVTFPEIAKPPFSDLPLLPEKGLKSFLTPLPELAHS